MIKKENKIYVIVSTDPHEREQTIARLAVRLNFARVPSDALKIISKDIYSMTSILRISFFAAITISVVPSLPHSASMNSPHGVSVLWLA